MPWPMTNGGILPGERGNPRPHDLYRLYDKQGALLYVGITVNFTARKASHERDKAWWCLVAEAVLEPYGSRRAALDAEKAAIIAEVPRFNTVHNPRPKVSLKHVGRERAALDRHIKEVVDSAPPLSDEQLRRLAILLGPAPRERGCNGRQ